MNEPAPCAVQPGHACSPSPPRSLADTLRRFEQEAVHGACDTGRYRCPYFTWGSGPPLLLVPGLSDDARSFVAVSALLSEQFRCIAYDLPAGRGDGARLGRYGHDDLVADAVALLHHLGVGQSYLLGSSFGSTIVLSALRAFPERFPRAVLQGGFACRRLAPAEVLLARLARYWPGRMHRFPFRRAILHRSHHEPFESKPPEVWDYFLTRWGAPPIAAVAQRALMLQRLDLRSILSEIHQPVLLVCGDADPLVSPACEEVLLRGLPHVGRVELPDCGHNPLFTHPEALADITRRFLTPPGQGCQPGTVASGTRGQGPMDDLNGV